MKLILEEIVLLSNTLKKLTGQLPKIEDELIFFSQKTCLSFYSTCWVKFKQLKSHNMQTQFSPV